MNEKISKLQAFQRAAFGLAKLASRDHQNVFDIVKTELPLSDQGHDHVLFMNLNWYPVQSLLSGLGAVSSARQQLTSSTAVFSRRHHNYGVFITGVADQCCSLEVVTQISKKEEEPECWVVGTLKQYLSSDIVQALVSTINKTSTPCPETVDWILSSLGQCFSTSLSLLLYCPLLYFAFPEPLGCQPSCIILSRLPQSCGITPGSSLPLCLFSEVLDGYW